MELVGNQLAYRFPESASKLLTVSFGAIHRFENPFGRLCCLPLSPLLSLIRRRLNAPLKLHGEKVEEFEFTKVKNSWVLSALESNWPNIIEYAKRFLEVFPNKESEVLHIF